MKSEIIKGNYNISYFFVEVNLPISVVSSLSFLSDCSDRLLKISLTN